MSGEISITAQGWSDLYEVCHAQDKRFLAEALSCHQEQVVENYDFDQGVEEWMLFAQDVLADEAYSLVQANNTCDDGGFAYWIDKSGYYKVDLPD